MFQFLNTMHAYSLLWVDNAQMPLSRIHFLCLPLNYANEIVMGMSVIDGDAQAHSEGFNFKMQTRYTWLMVLSAFMIVVTILCLIMSYKVTSYFASSSCGLAITFAHVSRDKHMDTALFFFFHLPKLPPPYNAFWNLIQCILWTMVTSFALHTWFMILNLYSPYPLAILI